MDQQLTKKENTNYELKGKELMKNDPNIPRLLTEPEIQDILAVVPKLKGAASEASEYNKESMLKTLREQLKEIFVTPLAINDIKEEILRQFNDSLIKPGSVVGVTAAEALGQPITQMALNSFHQSGSSKNVTYGVDRIRELINASENLKNTSCSIFFKNQNLSIDDIVIKVRPALTEIKVHSIIKGIPDIESTNGMEEPWWYGSYRMLIRSDFQSSSILRLKLDVDMMYAYKITMSDVVRVIEKDQSVIAVFSPLEIGELHIYPVEKAVNSRIKTDGLVERNNASMIFLWEAVIPSLDTMKISGITGITQIYPVEAPVWQIVKDEQKSGSIERGWFLIVNEVRQKITGISVAKLVHLCKTVGMEVFKIRDNYIGVKTPNGESPTEMINAAIKADKEDEKAYEENKRKEGARVVRRPPTDIMTASQIVYADSDGSFFKGNKSTLRTLLSNPNVDSTRTYCNNVHEIIAVLGLEAGRTFLIKEFIDVIGYEGAYINPRHIELLVDFMMSLGKVNGITFTGISRQPIGALEKASFERAMDTFAEASGFGEMKEVKGTSASIYVGKKALIGTGYSDQYMDKSKFKEIEKELEYDPNMVLDIGDFKDAVGEMDDIISGADIMLKEDEMFGETGDIDNLEGTMFGGEGPALQGGIIDPTFGMGKITDPGINYITKPGITRGTELNEAAATLNQAPCLMEPEPVKIRVEDIKSPLKMEALPFAGATVGVGNDAPETLGLPVGLLTEMKQFQYEEPPQDAPAPILGLPTLENLPGLGGLPPLAPPGQEIEVPKSEEVKQTLLPVFDLENF